MSLTGTKLVVFFRQSLGERRSHTCSIYGYTATAAGDSVSAAFLEAMREIGKADVDVAMKVTDEVINILASRGVEKPHVEEIQDLVELSLMRHGLYDVAKAYITYRKRREGGGLGKGLYSGLSPPDGLRKPSQSTRSGF
ncbi:MAG: ATP cone domain-containing protein [Candidatus Caldarchaeum sp.]